MAQDPPRALDGRGVDGEAVILRRDLDPAGREVLHRMVRAVVTERQLVGPAAGGEAQDLVAEANAEDRQAAQQRADRVDEVGDRFGVPGTVGQKYPVGLELPQRLGRCRVSARVPIPWMPTMPWVVR